MLAVPELIEAYMKYLYYIIRYNNQGQIDLSDMDFVYPTTLLPLAIFIKDNGIKYKGPVNPEVANYLELMIKGKGQLNKGLSSYIPLISLPQKEEESDIYYKELAGYLGEWLSNIYNVLEYVVYELVNNVYQHSKCTNAYIMAQRYEKRGLVELALIDNGITIAGSLRSSGRINDKVSDSSAICKALEGYSAKPEPGRGYGLSTSIRMITEELQGEVLMVSGKGLVYLTYKEDEGIGFISDLATYLKGTLVSLRSRLDLINTINIPEAARKVINLTRYNIQYIYSYLRIFSDLMVCGVAAY